MTRTLVAFGDSHTSGAEIEGQYSSSCYEKSYPAHIAKHYGFDYINYSQCGGSNMWILHEFYRVIPKLVDQGIPLFVLCNFTEVSRMFFHQINPDNSSEIIHLVSSNLAQLTNNNYQFCHPEELLIKYKKYLMNNSQRKLIEKTLLIIRKIQNFCKDNNIPFVFHTSIYWFPGDWTGIDKKNFFGHHDSDIIEYDKKMSKMYQYNYSYWGLASKYPICNKLKQYDRWKMHYPEEYHRFWAKILINFIDEQKILDTTTESE
jgi:hypothetical protein